MTVDTILMVDDSKRWINTVEEFIRTLYDIKTLDIVNSLQDAKQKVNENKYDLYVVDSLGGPHGDWKPTTEYIKQMHEGARIVINTAHPEIMETLVNDAGLELVDKLRFSDYLDAACKRKQ
jgi:DNA-binding NtrC family response regulator